MLQPALSEEESAIGMVESIWALELDRHGVQSHLSSKQAVPLGRLIDLSDRLFPLHKPLGPLGELNERTHVKALSPAPSSTEYIHSPNKYLLSMRCCPQG